MRDLRGKRCLVTGAASGIGRATAFALRAEGARLVLTDVNEEGLDAVVAELGAAVEHAEALDLTDLERVRELAAAVHRAGGPVDVVLNVAGISSWGAIETVDHDHWQRLVDVNLMGPIHVLECFVPAMVRGRRGGHIVNVSSAAGLLGLPWHAAYSATKFGLRGISEVLRFDLRRHRIGVSLICPGAVDTPLVQTVDIVGIDRDHPAAVKLAKHFRRHAASPDDVAAKIVDAIKQRKALVCTSRDIQAAFLLQRYCPPAYDLVMQLLNDRMVKVGEKARLPDHATAGDRA